ncbi:hypothetical protein J4446_00745 [Candidatus Woesearchaeota archaeon]|nr:hypothetical protein [Candidatus Woesearchaeota archaeon]
MTEVDRVLSPIFIKYEGNLDVKEIYKLIKDFLTDKRYDIDEKEHNYSEKGSLKMKWEATQNINDYVQFQIEVTVKGSGLKKIKLNKRDAFSGKFEVEIEAKINKDFRDYYEGKPIIKFFRELFDYTTKKYEFNRFGDQVKKEAYSLFDEIKAYLNVMKL